MEGKTHRMGGITFALVGFEVMRSNDLLIPDVNPLLQLAILYPLSQWSSTLPDLDHHWESTPNKTPVTKILHTLLHLTRPKHRAWQTHSILVTGGILALMFSLVFYGHYLAPSLNDKDWTILQLMVMGIILGVTSHLFLDSINPSGIHLIPNLKFHLVPKTKFFATGGAWETKVVFNVMSVVSTIYAIQIFLFSCFKYDMLKNLYTYIQTLF